MRDGPWHCGCNFYAIYGRRAGISRTFRIPHARHAAPNDGLANQAIWRHSVFVVPTPTSSKQMVSWADAEGRGEVSAVPPHTCAFTEYMAPRATREP